MTWLSQILSKRVRGGAMAAFTPMDWFLRPRRPSRGPVRFGVVHSRRLVWRHAVRCRRAGTPGWAGWRLACRPAPARAAAKGSSLPLSIFVAAAFGGRFLRRLVALP